VEKRRLPWAEIGITLAGIVLMAVIVLTVDPLRDSVSAALQGDHD